MLGALARESLGLGRGWMQRGSPEAQEGAGNHAGGGCELGRGWGRVQGSGVWRPTDVKKGPGLCRERLLWLGNWVV